MKLKSFWTLFLCWIVFFHLSKQQSTGVLHFPHTFSSHCHFYINKKQNLTWIACSHKVHNFFLKVKLTDYKTFGWKLGCVLPPVVSTATLNCSWIQVLAVIHIQKRGEKKKQFHLSVSFIHPSQSPPPPLLLPVLFISAWIVGRLSTEMWLLKPAGFIRQPLWYLPDTHTHRNTHTKLPCTHDSFKNIPTKSINVVEMD